MSAVSVFGATAIDPGELRAVAAMVDAVGTKAAAEYVFALPRAVLLPETLADPDRWASRLREIADFLERSERGEAWSGNPKFQESIKRLKDFNARQAANRSPRCSV